MVEKVNYHVELCQINLCLDAVHVDLAMVAQEEAVAVRQATSDHRHFELPFLQAMVRVHLEAEGAQVLMVRGNCICRDRTRRRLAGQRAGRMCFW